MSKGPPHLPDRPLYIAGDARLRATSRVGNGTSVGEPQGLKPSSWVTIGGTAEAGPFPVLFSSKSLKPKSKAAGGGARSTRDHRFTCSRQKEKAVEISLNGLY